MCIRDRVVTEGAGFKPSTTVVVFIKTQILGSLTTKANGTFRAAFFMPTKLDPGVEVIQVNGITKNNVLRSVSLPIVISGSKNFTLKKSVYFLGDSAKVTGQGGKVLLSILSELRGKKNIVVNVSGWVKETSDKSYDARLSKERAKNMVYVLEEIYGIKAKYFYKGYGISPENTDKSRRADIVITYTK
jgi:outer membrane protein OmpA-like peptidoglycan-associated protein